MARTMAIHSSDGPLDGMVRATGRAKTEFCLACFDGNQPVLDEDRLEDKEICLTH